MSGYGSMSGTERDAGRMKDDQKAIYYILGDDRQSVTHSPHLDYFRGAGYEVLTLSANSPAIPEFVKPAAPAVALTAA